MIRVETNNPVAVDSPDHIYPLGTKWDNSTNHRFIDDVDNYFKRNINFLDLGCSGGQLVKDFLDRGNVSVGLEGSDYSAKIGRANWSELYNKNLFTCDITKPFKVYDDDTLLKFECITAWEVLEHPKLDDIHGLLENVYNNLNTGGIFAGTIALYSDFRDGVEYHQNLLPEEGWYALLYQYFDEVPNIIHNWVRESQLYFCVKSIN